MKLPYNPFTLRRQLKYYISLCNAQGQDIVNANEHIAQLIDESNHKTKLIQRLEKDLEIANNQIKASEIAVELITNQKGK
ncbi:hypothetical protein A6B43_00435 [Vespertiliibacter pulmonis]|uniref:Uncharacterized protein n=1 Tax=Vespertiliibacter pulmonis TaxID=1443036 RepID=A0A3N4W159_9PAST|nr:hypothetical protein [Vespertiliibacter pulmonis]QLB20045.1 hypothetical protein A6B43_00085 [Vespertiliibacter pulmonis]QLB20111.1 hypothetical protein A6B43_00435 [Vespertiliibacter pulmonis]RPE86079.1 hypothetical protein EDC46_0471 [Vespertiliibacter pulmonis]